MIGASFSKQIDNFVFIFYPKAWTMPNMAVRHVHNLSYPRNSYGIDEKGQCLKDVRVLKKLDYLGHGRCEAICTSELRRQACHEMLGIGEDGFVPSFFTETVTFKSLTPKRLAKEWYVRRYSNKYTKGKDRYVFYHDCLKGAAERTFFKGLYDHMLPYLDVPWGCQVCGAKIPTGVQMAVQLKKANIHV